ncbi:hypothetical protein K239x_23120 [Planctomycetes bacterium K23_9]|uniref:Uncharacterized protein n=1 Tax=Stieleria marina TaxID=1930275 RepID=A0A517NTA4_9BACT|nr:hypothetical protein K239x_23120 [Planctomycetes bacterium K23_9]
MKFRSPGWGIGWFTALLVIAAPAVAYGSFSTGSTFFGVFWLSVGVFAALTWFRQRWAAIPLIVYFLLALTTVSVAFALKGFSVSLLGKFLFSCSCICELFAWYRKKPEDREFDELKAKDGDAWNS